jgi:STE24 endopeptidase
MANEDKATRYHRQQRRAAVASTAFSATALVGLLLSGGSAWLRDIVVGLAEGRFIPAVALYAGALGLFIECVQVPFAYYQGVTLEKHYGLSTQTVVRWWFDRAKSLIIGLLFGVVAAAILWSLLRWVPAYWWAIAAAAFGVLVVALAQLGPVLLLPMFYRLRPLDRPPLTARLAALAERARAPIVGVFEWQLSDRTRKANAALAGVGRTRRILLSDTLLAAHSDDEIEVILAHELAHYVHHDIWSAIALDAGLMAVGFYVTDRVLAVAVPVLGMSSKADPAGMPLVLLAAGAVSLLLLPLAHALSRFHERRADRYALEMTGNAETFVRAMSRLSVQNLSEEQPSRLVELLFHSHPPVSARIAAARGGTKNEELRTKN